MIDEINRYDIIVRRKGVDIVSYVGVHNSHGRWVLFEDVENLANALREKERELAEERRLTSKLRGDPSGGPSSIVGRAYHF